MPCNFKMIPVGQRTFIERCPEFIRSPDLMLVLVRSILGSTALVNFDISVIVIGFPKQLKQPNHDSLCQPLLCWLRGWSASALLGSVRTGHVPSMAQIVKLAHCHRGVLGVHKFSL